MTAIVPNMGIPRSKTPKLSDVLFSKTQQQVLGLLFGNPDKSFYARDIVRFAGVGIGSVYRELEKLSAVGLLTVETVDNRKHYQANRESLIFDELTNILHKVSGNRSAQAAK